MPRSETDSNASEHSFHLQSCSDPTSSVCNSLINFAPLGPSSPFPSSSSPLPSSLCRTWLSCPCPCPCPCPSERKYDLLLLNPIAELAVLASSKSSAVSSSSSSLSSIVVPASEADADVVALALTLLLSFSRSMSRTECGRGLPGLLRDDSWGSAARIGASWCWR